MILLAKNAQITVSSVMISSNVNNVPLDTKFKNLLSQIKKCKFVARSVVMVSGIKLNVMMVILRMVMVAAANVLFSHHGLAPMDQLCRNLSVLSIFLRKVFLLIKVLSIWETELFRVLELHSFPNV